MAFGGETALSRIERKIYSNAVVATPDSSENPVPACLKRIAPLPTPLRGGYAANLGDGLILACGGRTTTRQDYSNRACYKYDTGRNLW